MNDTAPVEPSTLTVGDRALALLIVTNRVSSDDVEKAYAVASKTVTQPSESREARLVGLLRMVYNADKHCVLGDELTELIADELAAGDTP